MARENEVLFGRIAVHSRMLSREHLEEALHLQRRRFPRKHIGQILLDQERLTSEQVEAILRLQQASLINRTDPEASRRRAERLGSLAVARGFSTPAAVAEALAIQAEMNRVELYPNLGDLLIQRGALTIERLRELLREQEKTVLRCGLCGTKYNVLGYRPGLELRCRRCGGALRQPQEVTVPSVDEELVASPAAHATPPAAPKGKAALPPAVPPAVSPPSPPSPARRPAMPPTIVQPGGGRGRPVSEKTRDQIPVVGMALPTVVRAGAPSPGGAAAPAAPATAEAAVTPAAQLAAPGYRLPEPGLHLGGCELTERIGVGGMGEVWRARHITLEKTVAVKILPLHFSLEEQAVGRFVREARAAAKLEHPEIVQMLNLGEEHGLYYIVMQYAPGRSLADILHERKFLPVRETFPLVRQVAGALGYAHARSFVHRDIKPGNLIVAEDGSLKIIDFGLTKNLLSDANLTTEGMTVGTVNYMSPEQASGRDLDGRSDLYSLGVVWYEMLTGRVPFTAESPWQILFMHQTEPAPDPRRWRPRLPPALARLVLKLLEKEPGERLATAAELLAALERLERRLEREEAERKAAKALPQKEARS